MTKQESRRLKPGQVVVFGDKKYTASCSLFREAVVERVTPNGGILCREFRDGRRASRAMWVPYHYVAWVRPAPTRPSYLD